MSERFAFTRKRLESATCPADAKSAASFYDEGEPGLLLLVTPAGAKTFYLYRKIDGRPERINLGKFPDISVDDARDAARIHKGKIARGINPADERRAERGEMTLGELLTHYIDTHAKHHKRTWQEDKAKFERYFGKPEAERKPEDKPAAFPGWRNRRVNAITYDDVQTLHVKIGENHGKIVANRVLALLSVMFNKAKLNNPCKGVAKFKEQSRERFVQSDEMPKFFAALDAEENKTMVDFFRVALFTGARRSNVQAMAWADVNFSRLTWTIPGEQVKSGKPLTIHLSEPAMEVLRRRWKERTTDDTPREDGDTTPRKSDYVFPSDGETCHLVEPKAAWARILNRAKIKDLRIHDLRRTLGSWQAAAGVSSAIIGKSLGHLTTSTTAIYSRLNLAPVAAAVDLAASAMVKASAVKEPAKGKRTKKTA